MMKPMHAYGYDHAHPLVLDSEDLPVERLNLVKAVFVDDAEHEQKALSCPHVLFSHSGVFLIVA